MIQYQYTIYSVDIPNVLVLDIESEAHLEFIAACEFLKHCIVVLRVVTGDVPDLENRVAC